MWFKILYLIYIVVAYLFPTVSFLGPVSIRHIMMVVMLIVCVRKGVGWDKYMTLFTVFLFFLGLSSIITGFASQFINKLIGTYLQAYVMFFATYIMIKKYNGEMWLYCFFLVFGLLDAFVTIGQFYNIDFANRIVEFLGITFEEEYESKMEGLDIREGYSLYGLVGTVRNGYFLSAIAVLSLYSKKGKIAISNWVVWFVVITASLLSQQRMGFYVAALLSFIVIVSTISVRTRKAGWIIALVFVFVALLFLPMGLDALQGSNLRFSKELDYGGERGVLARIGWNYFLNNPLGAYYEYEASGYPYPHNVFVSMFLVGGLFGGVAILIMFLKQLVALVKYFLKSLRLHRLTLAAFFALMFVAYSMSSFAHNMSIVFGTFEFFVFWGAFKALHFKETNNDCLRLNYT